MRVLCTHSPATPQPLLKGLSGTMSCPYSYVKQSSLRAIQICWQKSLSTLPIQKCCGSLISVQYFLSISMTSALCRKHKGVQCIENRPHLQRKHSQLSKSGLYQIYSIDTASQPHTALLHTARAAAQHAPVPLRMTGQTMCAHTGPLFVQLPDTRKPHTDGVTHTHTPNHTSVAGSTWAQLMRGSHGVPSHRGTAGFPQFSQPDSPRGRPRTQASNTGLDEKPLPVRGLFPSTPGQSLRDPARHHQRARGSQARRPRSPRCYVSWNAQPRPWWGPPALSRRPGRPPPRAALREGSSRPHPNRPRARGRCPLPAPQPTLRGRHPGARGATPIGSALRPIAETTASSRPMAEVARGGQRAARARLQCGRSLPAGQWRRRSCGGAARPRRPEEGGGCRDNRRPGGAGQPRRPRPPAHPG